MLSQATVLTTGALLVVLASCPLSLIAWRFVRLIAILALILSASLLAGHWIGPPPQAGGWAMWSAVLAIACAATLLLFLASLTGAGPAGPRCMRIVALTGGVLGLLGGLASVDLVILPGPRGVPVLAAAGYVLSAMLLAGVNMGWLLGHRYLTAPGMSITPLRRVTAILAATLVARWGFLMLVTTLCWMGAPDAALRTRLTQNWLLLSVRVGVGLVLPAVLVWMAWACVRLRSTQSATGILFFTSVFIAIGELTSQQLAAEWQVPV